MVGRYVILEAIGRGGMGVVYSAYDVQLDRKLAIKFLRPDLAGSAGAKEAETRLVREAQAMARLVHPNVVAVHDVGMFEHRLFLAMDYVDGMTLKDWLRAAPRPFRQRLDVLRAAGRGLVAAHDAGLVHRDFKPSNVLVGNDGRVLVTDFGVARVEADPTRSGTLDVRIEAQLESRVPTLPPRPSDPLTLTGGVMGTVGYMAPEQGFGQGTSAATDQFSYAATAYRVLYGERPYPGKTLEDYLEALERPMATPKGAVEVPAWIRRILLRGLSIEPADRYPSLHALLAALDDDPSVKWKRRGIALLGVALTALAAIGVVAGVRHRKSECASDPADLAGAWGEPISKEIQKTFEGASVPGGAEMAGRAIARIDEFASEWAAARSETCGATHLRKQQSEEVYRLRMDCLDRQRTALRATTSMLAKADSSVVLKSLDIAYGLPEVSWCANVSALRASPGLPDDPEKRARVLELRGELARVDVLYLAGKPAEAAAEARDVVTASRAVGSPAAVAEALFFLGRALGNRGEFPEAYASLSEATWTALSSGTDVVGARAAAWASYVAAMSHRLDEAHMWLEISRTSLARSSADDALETEVLDAEASLLSLEGRPEQASELNDRIVTRLRQTVGVHPRTTAAIFNRAVNHVTLGEFGLALPLYEEALSMSTQLGGPLSVTSALNESALGNCLVALGELDRGERVLMQAVAHLKTNSVGFWAAETLSSLVLARLTRGDAEGALVFAEEALALPAAQQSDALAADVGVPAADALNLLGRPKEALRLCDRALSEQEKNGELDPAKPYGLDSQRCKADALTLLHRPAEAVPLLERSLTFKRRQWPFDYARAELSLANAFFAEGRELPRARGLAASARDEFAKQPHLKAELARAETLLRALRARL